MTSTTSSTSRITPQASSQELFRFLEDRFGCALACTECAQACALRAGLVDPHGSHDHEHLRRKGILCAEVCDATCRALSEDHQMSEAALRVQLEWCRTVCLETAHALDRHPGAEETAAACRTCARACADFMASLV